LALGESGRTGHDEGCANGSRNTGFHSENLLNRKREKNNTHNGSFSLSLNSQLAINVPESKTGAGILKAQAYRLCFHSKYIRFVANLENDQSEIPQPTSLNLRCMSQLAN
jgi:hypothetical protein